MNRFQLKQNQCQSNIFLTHDPTNITLSTATISQIIHPTKWSSSPSSSLKFQASLTSTLPYLPTFTYWDCQQAQCKTFYRQNNNHHHSRFFYFKIDFKVNQLPNQLSVTNGGIILALLLKSYPHRSKRVTGSSNLSSSPIYMNLDFQSQPIFSLTSDSHEYQPGNQDTMPL